MRSGRILFIDAYDSFSNNIVRLLEQELKAEVGSIKIDDSRFVLNDDAFFHFLDRYDAVVAGPGPGHPANTQDVGLIAKLWNIPDEHALPVLGICLGFQSLCFSQGAQIVPLQQPRHGIVTAISHRSESIFAGINNLRATQYHSLHARVTSVLDAKLSDDALWQAPASCNDLLLLAWDLSDDNNGPILMAAQHHRKPLIGIQFHPESICTNDQGPQLIRNWWQFSLDWNLAHQRHAYSTFAYGSHSKAGSDVYSNILSSSPLLPVQYKQCSLPTEFDVVHCVSALRALHHFYEPILLQSGVKDGQLINSKTGTHSIVALHDETSLHVRYSCSSRQLDIGSAGRTESRSQASVGDVFTLLEGLVRAHKAANGPSTPFWGGFVGFISYEAGLETIEVLPSSPTCESADIWFIMVERSIVIDHVGHCVFIQSLRPDDSMWIDSMLDFMSIEHPKEASKPSTCSIAKMVSSPSKDEYCEKVRDCQRHLNAGSSYELCLTEQTTLCSNIDAWTLYRRLSSINPAPFGTFLRFEAAGLSHLGVSIVGSSPERFLCWSRDGKCQFRPIKGTVSKIDGASKAVAVDMLGSKKEQAENLMIVDLIRHDLAGVPRISNVRTTSLMAIEEYATVFQLVSVIEGDLDSKYSGINVLAASLPPGSMTGAPKQRSCELLKSLEENRSRSIYSGVIGYLDVGGGADFSVVIRTAFRWDSEPEWRVGAGGAVTVLSTAEAEFDEMVTKRERLMTAFS